MTEVPTPPFNQEAEEAVLGSVLLNPVTYHEVSGVLRSESFFLHRHRFIWQAFEKLVRKDRDIDIITTSEALDNLHKLEDVGGQVYLTKLINATPSSLRARDYAGIVAENAAKRELQALASDLYKLSREDGHSPAELMSDAYSLLNVASAGIPIGAADTWTDQLFSLEEAYKERLPREYLVSSLIKIPSVNVFYGRPGGLKTMLALSMAGAVVAGKRWLPPFPGSLQLTGFETLQAPVIAIDFDNGRLEMHDKIAAIGRGYELETSAPFYYYSMPAPILDAGNLSHMRTLASRICELEPL